MWGFRSDIRAVRRVFDACPIYSALERTDLRSTTSRHGRRDSPGCTARLAARSRPPSSPRSPPRRSPPAPTPALLTAVGDELRRRAHHPAVQALRRLGQLQAAPGRLVRGRDGRVAAQRRGQDRVGQRELQGRRRHAQPLAVAAQWQRRRLAVHLRRPRRADPAPVRQAQQRAARPRVDPQRPDPGADQPRPLRLAPGAAGRPRGQLVAPDREDAADREHPAAVGVGQDAGPVPVLAAARLLADRRRLRRSVHAAARRARPNPAARRTSPGAASAGTGTAPASRGADRDRDRPPAPRARPAVLARGPGRRGPR